METVDNTKRIGFVCFMASFIGALLTLAVAEQFALGWWLAPIGAATFGLTAYLGYEWRAVGRAVVHASRAAVNWRPGKDSWLWYGLSLSGGISVPLLLLAILVWGFLPPDPWFLAPAFTEDPQNEPAVLILITSSFIIPCAMSVFGTIGYHDRFRLTRRHLAEDKGFPFTSWTWRQQALFINPLTAPIITVLLYLVVPLGLIGGIGWLVYKAVKATANALIIFTISFFRYLHSEERRICLTATMLGVIVGFAVGYPQELVLLGAIAGGLTGSALGVAEYRLARWLRLVPAPVKVG